MHKLKTKIGIVSYGGYIPRYRITVDEIASVYKKDPLRMKNGLGLLEKTVPGRDEDTISVAVNAARQMSLRFDLKKHKINIGAVYVGSESHPYSVKSTAAIVGDSLGIGNDYTAADTEFACKAGTASIQMILGLVGADLIDYGIAIGADTAQGAPGDALEYSAGCAGAAFLLGKKDIIVNILHTTSTTSDIPDFWRRSHQWYPKHGGRFTGRPAYYSKVIANTKKILDESKTKIEDYDHVIFHMPNGKFPKAVAKILNVTNDQLKYGYIVDRLGNSYSACSLMGLVGVLDRAKPNDKILLTSYGSGAGSDSFVLEVTQNIIKYKKHRAQLSNDRTLEEMILDKEYLTYGQYVNHTNKLRY